MELKIQHLESIDTVARQFWSCMGDQKVIAFYGDMGAGKTTFIKAICKHLKVTDEVTSPTFAIIYEYNTEVFSKIYHFDFYRIKNIEEVYDFGYEDYFYGGSYCFIEWPELVEDILPENTMKVYLSVKEDQSRVIRISS